MALGSLGRAVLPITTLGTWMWTTTLLIILGGGCLLKVTVGGLYWPNLITGGELLSTNIMITPGGCRLLKVVDLTTGGILLQT